MQKGWLRITDDFVVMPIEEAQPRVEHGAVVQGCEAKEEVGWIGDGGGSVSLTKSTRTEQREILVFTLKEGCALEDGIMRGM